MTSSTLNVEGMSGVQVRPGATVFSLISRSVSDSPEGARELFCAYIFNTGLNMLVLRRY